MLSMSHILTIFVAKNSNGMNPINKHTWLIETIRRRGFITFNELSNLWENDKRMSDGKELSRTNFNRWRKAIFEQFGIRISCSKGGDYTYSISNPEVIAKNELKKWMLDSFSVNLLLNEHIALKDRILVESIPSGLDHLPTVLTAMKEGKKVEIDYHPFDRENSAKLKVEPYCIKLFEHRWYILGHNERNKMRNYSLDRVMSIKLLDEKFEMPEDFDAKDFFEPFFGIVVKSEKRCRIVLRANKKQKHYLRTVPLHSSQVELQDCGDYADFELFLVPTYDFIMELLRAGSKIEVLKPASLRQKMKEWSSGIYELYKND